MKLTNRTKSALATAGYPINENSAITQLVAFAAQNSGIDPRNYFSDWRDANGRKAYQTECRDISADWRRFKKALLIAASEGVTDADVVAQAPHAFSGRLEWRELSEPQKAIEAKAANGAPGAYWDYCTGQYFPTEYRKAAATLLDYATRAVRQSRPPEKRQIETISQLRALNEKNGGCWFTPDTMRFFKTKIETGIIDGQYFVTSDASGFGDSSPRKFTIRSFDAEGSVDTVEEFNKFDTLNDALAALAQRKAA